MRNFTLDVTSHQIFFKEMEFSIGMLLAINPKIRSETLNFKLFFRDTEPAKSDANRLSVGDNITEATDSRSRIEIHQTPPNCKSDALPANAHIPASNIESNSALASYPS